MAKAKACPVCGSNKWRKDAISGNAACEEGHVFQDYRSENLVVENVQHTLQKRTFRKGERRNKRREEGRANAALYHGEEGEWLKLQALQLMLRLQVQRMREIWQLPGVFETIVKELWAYQISTAQNPNPPGYVPADEDISKNRRTETEGPEEEKTNDDDKGDSSSDSEEGDQTEKEEGVDADILAELSDLSELSDMDDGDTGNVGKSGPKWKRRRRLRVSDTLVTLIIGLWILRVPVTNVDIESMINENILPYLDFARTTFIPEEMFNRMNRDVRLALTPRKSPSPLFLFDESRHFARILNRHFGLTFPEINLPPISWKVISSLGGTPTIYQLVHRVLRILNVNLGLLDEVVVQHTRKPRRGRLPTTEHEEMKEVTYERTKRNQDIIMPELSVAAAWVVVMKLAYGLDERDRSALDPTDPVVGMPEIKGWSQELENRLTRGDFKGNKKAMEKQNFPIMSTDDLDRYLDQCESILLSHHSTSTDAGPFPLLPKSSVPPKSKPTWTEHHASPIPISPGSPSADALQPGEEYKSYDAQDVTGELPRSYEVILKCAAQVIGVKAFDVGVVVELFERKLEGVRKERSRSRSRSKSQSRSRPASAGRRRKGVGLSR